MNTLTFDQTATVLNQIVKQATGLTLITATNSAEFVATLNTALLQGYDPLLNSISQILSGTIFSSRPYSAKFKGLQQDSESYGNHIRKLQISDLSFEDDTRLPLDDGTTIDMYKIRKPVTLQTNVYGQKPIQYHYTIHRDQLNTAFSGAAEFGRWLAMVTQNVSDTMEQALESIARGALTSFIAGKIDGDPDSCIHLLTEYNTATGLSLTATSVLQPANYKSFVQWMYSRIAKLSAFLTERTNLFQLNVTNFNGANHTIMRHTPKRDQRLFLHSSLRFDAEAMALADIYHDNYLNMSIVETVNFWQSVKSPLSINTTPTYIDETGALVTPTAPIVMDNVVGVIIDREAVGHTTIPESNWAAPTPFNPAGGYHNMFFHRMERFWNDFTEKGIILLLD